MSSKTKLPASLKSIAVLPFVNMSADQENEYFSDGISEEIINALNAIKGLRVIARTSSFAFKNQNIDVRSIGDQLGVSTILEGSVRRDRNRVRITAQLISTEDGTHYWSKNFDREIEDIFAIQDEISLQIAEQIRENFGHLHIQEHLIVPPTKNMDAYDLYLKARYQHLLWDGQGIRNSVELYTQCIAVDPTFALPYFGLGYSFAMYGSWGNDKSILQLSQQNLRLGFKLESESYVGYFAKATLAFWGHWEFIKGHKFFHRAMTLNPSYTEAEEGLCELYTAIGYFAEAHELADHILGINPLSPNHYFTKGNIYYLSGDYSKALECIETSLSINPQFTQSIALKQVCLILTKESAKLNDFLNENPLVERADECRALYNLVHPDDAFDLEMNRVAVMVKEDLGAALLPWQLFLLVHMGQHEMALDFLEQNIKLRTGQIINFMHIPLLKPLYQYPRFQELVQSVFAPEFLPTKTINTSSDIPKALMSEEEAERALSFLKNGMQEEKWFQNAKLSLRELAQFLEISSNKLSWLLNERMGQNFSEYTNTCRLNHFKVIALEPAFSHLSLLGLAFESGFQSKSAFNAFFKKQEGLTPKEWLNLHQA